MSDVDAIVKRLKSAPTPPCTCGMDDNMHETTCAIYEWAKAWGELAALRAELEQARQCIAETVDTAAELAALRAELATATRTAEVWERQHREAVDIIEQREASIREFLFVQRLPENEKDQREAWTRAAAL